MTNDFIFPKFAHDDTFEEIVCDILAREFQNPNIQRYGRKGQSQTGLDIVGIAGKDYKRDELIGVQCKNHIIPINDKKLYKEVVDELKKFEKSHLPIQRFLFITSADNSVEVKNSVIELSKKRIAEGLCPVDIFFWDYIISKLSERKDILYKYFTHMLPTEKAENLTIPDYYKKTRHTLSVKAADLVGTEPSTLQDKLLQVIRTNIDNIQQGEPYNLYLGISSKNEVKFNGYVDLDMDFSELFNNEEELPEKFALMKTALKNLITVIVNSKFSKQLVLYTDIETSLAFLLGRILRKNKFDVKIVFKKQIWTTNQDELPYVPAELSEKLPQIIEVDNNEGIFIFDATNRSSAEDDVLTYIKSQKQTPRVVVVYKIASIQIINSAHALSVAKSIVSKIHMLESWKIKKIHLFLLAPKPLSFMIGYFLNTLNSSINLYFMDGTRTQYLLSGTVNNNTF